MTIDEVMDFPCDPRLLLGVSKGAGDREIESAWRKTDSPEAGILFKAYLMLRDESSRIRTDLSSLQPYSKASDVISALKKHPIYIGPGPWYAAIARMHHS